MAPTSRRGVRTVLLAVLVAATAASGACSSGGKHDAKPPPTTSAATAAQTLLAAGIKQADANMLSEATATFGDVLVIDPKNTYALYNLGLINQKQQKDSGAISYYDKALSISPKYTPAIYNKAIIVEATNLNEALGLYRQIVTINPKASTAYLRMAFIYAKQGNAAQAIQARNKAIALDPSLAKYPLPAKCGTPNC